MVPSSRKCRADHRTVQTVLWPTTRSVAPLSNDTPPPSTSVALFSPQLEHSSFSPLLGVPPVEVSWTPWGGGGEGRDPSFKPAFMCEAALIDFLMADATVALIVRFRLLSVLSVQGRRKDGFP